MPSTLAMKVRVLSTGGGRKTDPDDAYAVALCALHHKGLHAVHRKDQTTILRLLSERRPPVEPRSDCPPTKRLFVIQSALASFVECAAVEQPAQSVVGEVSESEGVAAQCFQTAVDRFGGVLPLLYLHGLSSGDFVARAGAVPRLDQGACPRRSRR